MKRLLFKLSGYLPCRIIDIDDKPYLERYYLFSVLGREFYLHRFVSGDGDRNLHDHPWDFSFSLVLTGSYDEVVQKYFCPKSLGILKKRKLKRGRFNIIKGSKFHQIVSAEPETWTLFVTGKRIKDWGFLKTYKGIKAVFYTQPYSTGANRDWQKRAKPGRLTKRSALCVAN